MNDLFITLSGHALKKYMKSQNDPLLTSSSEAGGGGGVSKKWSGSFRGLGVINLRPTKGDKLHKSLSQLSTVGDNANMIVSLPFDVPIAHIDLNNVQYTWTTAKMGYKPRFLAWTGAFLLDMGLLQFFVDTFMINKWYVACVCVFNAPHTNV